MKKKFEIDYTFGYDGWGIGQSFDTLDEVIKFLTPLKQYCLDFNVTEGSENITDHVKGLLNGLS